MRARCSGARSISMDLSVKAIKKAELEQSSIFQSAFWAEVKSASWQALAIAWQIKERKGTALILMRKLLPGLYLAYAPFAFDEELTGEEFALLAREIKQYLPRRTLLFRLDMVWGADEAEGKRVKECKESVQPEGTVRINLPEEYQLKERARRNLKKEKGVEVKLWDGDEDTFERFYAVYVLTGKRDGFEVRSKAYLRHILSIKDEKVKPLLYLAYHEGELSGGIINLRSEEEEVYLFGASVKHTDKTSCGYILQKTAIEEAIKEGVKVYDFYGIPSKTGGEHLSSLEVFKSAFGGKKVYRPASVDYIYMPFLASFYRFLEDCRYYLRRV